MNTVKNLFILSLLLLIIGCTEKPKDSSETSSLNKYSSLQIADFKIDTLNSITNPKSKYWELMFPNQEDLKDTYSFKEGYSEIFYSESVIAKSSLMLEGERVDNNTVILSINTGYNIDDVTEKITKQLNKSIGMYEEVKVSMLAVEPDAKEWQIDNFKIQLVSPAIGNKHVLIKEMKETPEF